MRRPSTSVAVTRVGTAVPPRAVRAGSSATLIFCIKARTAASRNFSGAKLSFVMSPSNIAPAECDTTAAAAAGRLLKQAGCALKDRSGPGDAGTRKLCGEDRVARGFGRRQPFPVRQYADAGQGERDVIIDREADGVAQLLVSEFHQSACGKDDRRKAEHR